MFNALSHFLCGKIYNLFEKKKGKRVFEMGNAMSESMFVCVSVYIVKL